MFHLSPVVVTYAFDPNGIREHHLLYSKTLAGTDILWLPVHRSQDSDSFVKINTSTFDRKFAALNKVFTFAII